MFSKRTRLLLYSLLFLWKIGWSPVAAAQFFLVKPRNVTVVEGHTVVLPCHVGNQAGRVQWSKDGFVLGFERDIPGYPRYSMLGNQAEGIHNLQIDEATIEDDGDYQCQVGPTLTEKAIRANATLTVLVPPRSIQFEGRANGSLVEVHQRESVRLACVVEGSKPAPQLRWYRNNVEIRPDSAKLRVEETEERRQTAVGTVRLSPSAEDNDAWYWCEAIHPAGGLRTGVRLSVLYPPGAPEIEGYQEGETLRAGDDVALTCTARGGNPPAELNWYRGSERLASRDGVLEFTVAPGDNGAVLRCEARNSVTPRPMAASVKLAVHFAPARVTVTGPREAKEGQSVTLSCATAPSNPPAEVSWVGDGRPLPSTSSSTSPHPAGGFVTTSNVTVTAGRQERSKMYSCYAVNQALGETKVETVDLSVLYPPSEPSILGYQAGTPVRAGAVHRMTCVTRGGNPLPTVRWFRGEREVPGTSTTTNDNVVSTELELVARESDNGAEFRCEASNTASAVPKSVSVRLTVHFPPPAVSLKVQPKVIKAGQKAVLVCESGGSNPEAVLSWWRDGFLLSPDHLDISTFDTPFGGRGQRATLSLNVSAADDGRSFTCQAANPALDVEAAVHEVATLRVLYKPEWPVEELTWDAVEGLFLTLNLTARANPGPATYSWFRDRAPLVDRGPGRRMGGSGPILTIDPVQRSDAGLYEVHATNEEGTAVARLNLNVKYGPRIERVTENATAAEGEEAHLECEVEANPPARLTWRRDGWDLSDRATVTSSPGHSLLTLRNISRHDSGHFECVADNGVGTERARAALLLVEHAPSIEKTPARAAADPGTTARLICRARASPTPAFAWRRNGVALTTGAKFASTQAVRVGVTLWEARLEIRRLAVEDYGTYECEALNGLGSDRFLVNLDRPSAPEAPTSLRVLNVSSDAVVLQCEPGFDGGRAQMFRVRYRQVDAESFSYVEVGNATTFVVERLGHTSRYAFSLLAYNILGSSGYTQDPVFATTLAEPPPAAATGRRAITEALSSKGDLPKIIIITVSIVGSALLLLNIILVICFVRRRRKKRLEEAESERGSSTTKTATIEMYAPSSYTEPAVTAASCETLSCTSDKSAGLYSDNYSDDPSTKGTSTYIIDKGGERPYIPDGGYRYLDPVQSYKSLDLSSSVIYETDEDRYAEALRRNAYNHTIGDKPPMPDVMLPTARYAPYPGSMSTFTSGDGHLV